LRLHGAYDRLARDVMPILGVVLCQVHPLFRKILASPGHRKIADACRCVRIERPEQLQDKVYVRYEHLPLERYSGQKAKVEFISNVDVEDHHRVVPCNIRDIAESSEARNIRGFAWKREGDKDRAMAYAEAGDFDAAVKRQRKLIELAPEGAGSLAVLLVWLYCASQIFLCGAEVTKAHANQMGTRIKPKRLCLIQWNVCKQQA